MTTGYMEKKLSAAAIKGLILLLLLATVFHACSSLEDTPPKSRSVPFPQQPNIIVILTDQERHAMHWPQGWAENHLLSMKRLKQHGLTFNKAYTAACECSPSRAVLTTGEHYPINKVPRTPPMSGMPSAQELIDIGSLLKEHAGYEVVWKGKWHLSMPLEGGYNWTEKDIANVQEKYAIYGWTPPDAGNAIQEYEKNVDETMYNGLKTLGGGYADNDSRYLHGYDKSDLKETPGWGEGVLDYLKNVAANDAKERKPFCLFISLVNPHDIWVYPKHWEAAGYQKEAFAQMEIPLPPNFEDPLTTKPSIQLKARNAFDQASPLADRAAEREYVNFYAYLNTLADAHVGTILDALDSLGLTDDTLIIRTADHGELGLSHGMREKAYTVYEEMIHIPLIISNPKIYPSPQETEAFYCHLDLLPTIAELVGIKDYSRYGKGVSIAPVLKDPTTSVQDSVLFTYDDVFFLPEDEPGSHIRAIRAGDWTYAVYYSANGSNFEYEMYDLSNDPGQMHNLLHGILSPHVAQEANRLHKKLKEKIDSANALPEGFPWPQAPF